MAATGTAPIKTRPQKSVLVADDSAAIRKTLAEFFSVDFKICAEAVNGQEAIDSVKQFTPDLIILDLSMPVMNGLQAASEIRKIAPETVIILFTVFAGELALDPSKATLIWCFLKRLRWNCSKRTLWSY